jgi:hypothetical protein
MQSIAVDSAQNKGLLWATLHESGAFAGLTKDQFQPVQSAFDRSVQQAAAKTGGAVSLSDANKHVIRDFMQVLRTFQTQTPPPGPVPEKKKKIELIYRSEDIQGERASEFDRQLRLKQAEMDSFLTLKKPDDVIFADKDKGMGEDKPIGDEMSRLIANELAARERELVQLKPEDIKRAQQWIGTNATNNGDNNANNPNPNPNPVKKTVSFSEEEDDIETESIFSKLKKMKDDPVMPKESASEFKSIPINIADLHEKLLELEQRINANHAEVMTCFKRMYDVK